MLEEESPIVVVVDRVAEAIAKAWNKSRSEPTGSTNSEEAAFLSVAYQYLGARQVATYKMEQVRHLEQTEARYTSPPKSEELYAELRPPSAIGTALFVGVVCLLAFAGIYGVLACIGWLIENIGHILEGLLSLVTSKELLVALGEITSYLAVLFMFLFLGRQFLRRQWEYVFEGVDHIAWQMVQEQSSEQIGSERAQILAMIGGPLDGGTLGPARADDDLLNAKENPVPIQPGIAEFVLSTNRVTLDDLGNDFREARNQHNVVFWITFVAFLACLFGGVAAALILKQDLRSIGGTTAISTLMGTFSYKMLARARLARISLTLFNSYVIELYERIEEAKNAKGEQEARKLRSAAWTNFRLGMNKLYVLEGRSGSKKSS